MPASLARKPNVAPVREVGDAGRAVSVTVGAVVSFGGPVAVVVVVVLGGGATVAGAVVAGGATGAVVVV